MHLINFLHLVSQESFKIRPATPPKVCFDLPEHDFENALASLTVGEFASNEASKWFNTKNIDFSVSTGSIYIRCVYDGFVKIEPTEDIPTELYPSHFSQTLSLFSRKGKHSAFILRGDADVVKWLKANGITYAETNTAEIEVAVDTELPQVFEELPLEAAAQLAISQHVLKIYNKYLDFVEAKSKTDVLSTEQKAYLKNFNISSGWRTPSTSEFESDSYEMQIKGNSNIPNIAEVLADEAAGKIKPDTAKAWTAECIKDLKVAVDTKGMTVVRFELNRELLDIRRNIQAMIAVCDLTPFHESTVVPVQGREVIFKFKAGTNG